jgi:hypothetical protein
VFFFPHFGPEAKGYAPAEARLYAKQTRLIELLMKAQGAAWFTPPPEDGQRAFAAKSLPESWWWRNFKDQVTAMTIESVYGRAGGSRRWTTPGDMRRMGASLARAIAAFHGLDQRGRRPQLAVGH